MAPAAVLYVLAARVSSDLASAPSWWVTSISLLWALTPLAVVGFGSSAHGASRLAALGASFAVALATTRTGSPGFDAAHATAWLVAVLVMLDLVLPATTSSRVRFGMLTAFGALSLTVAWLARQGTIPDVAFSVVVLSGMLLTAALHQVWLGGRGRVVEGALSGVALVAVTIALAYAWLGTLSTRPSITIEFLASALLWSGHLAWIDPRWRSLRRVGIPVIVACCACFGLAFALSASETLGRWQVGMLGVVSGLVWWGVFAAARRISSRAAWSISDRLVSSARAIRRQLLECETLEEVASAVLSPWLVVSTHAVGRAELQTFDPAFRMVLGDGGRPSTRPMDPIDPVAEAVFARDEKHVLDLLDLRTKVVRDPSVRALVQRMEERSLGMIIPCGRDEHVEGLLLLPLGERAEPLSKVDRDELERLGTVVGAALASVLTRRRAQGHIERLSALRRDAERRIRTLEDEVEQLRGQCHLLGRGLAEDQTLHVAYSPSMRRVQTRAIELASDDAPVLLVASAGAPVLPVSRFIHDRGPRWEGPFVVADCSAAMPEQVMSLLFGSEGRGVAGWFDSATGGTLLLRDLPALPAAAQARLVTALRDDVVTREASSEPRSRPPRVLATSRIPESELRRRRAIDPDLAALFRNPGLEIPPLRHRREDVPSLVLLAIDRACRVLALDPVGIRHDAMKALIDHDWPGDVAELELVVSLAVSKVSQKMISLDDLPPLAWAESSQEESLDGSYLEVERRLLERTLRRTGGNKSEAARLLGLKRTTFLDKLRRHGLETRVSRDLGALR